MSKSGYLLAPLLLLLASVVVIRMGKLICDWGLLSHFYFAIVKIKYDKITRNGGTIGNTLW
jgi:uncharacterized membrane protein YobD (UPF0266 family)